MLWNLKIHKSPALNPVLCQFGSYLYKYFSKIHLKISCQCVCVCVCVDLQVISFLRPFMQVSCLPICATCSTYCFLLEFITLRILVNAYLDPNILLNPCYTPQPIWKNLVMYIIIVDKLLMTDEHWKYGLVMKCIVKEFNVKNVRFSWSRTLSVNTLQLGSECRDMIILNIHVEWYDMTLNHRCLPSDQLSSWDRDIVHTALLQVESAQSANIFMKQSAGVHQE
jgi:hypothetical protein